MFLNPQNDTVISEIKVMLCFVRFCSVQFYYFLAVTSGGHNLNKTITALCYSSLFWWKYCYDQVLIAAFKV